MLYLLLFIFSFPFVLLCSIQLIVTKPTSSLVAHPFCLLSRSYFSLFLLFFFYSHSTRCSFPLHIVTWIHIIGLSVGELSSRTVTCSTPLAPLILPLLLYYTILITTVLLSSDDEYYLIPQ